MPHCIHFGICGGCAVDSFSAIDKSALLASALAKAGFADAPIVPLMLTPLRSRRRVDLGAARDGPAIALGLHRARSSEVVDMTECVLLRPELFALLAPLRTLLRSLEAFRRTGAVQINWLDSGADILLRMDAPFTAGDRRRVIDFASAQSVLRIGIATGHETPEPVIILAPPVVTLSGIAVEPPPGAFLQASRAGESAIIAAVRAGLPKLNKKSRIVELYAGIGTITFALAQHARVEAYEGAAQAAAAAEKAIRASNLAGRVTMEPRDLARRPVQQPDFSGRAAVILDPPFAGAGPQMRFLAASGVARIIYISCSPEALSHDAAQLHHAGYTILSATPIDQFPYSENIESVVVFQKT